MRKKSTGSADFSCGFSVFFKRDFRGTETNCPLPGAGLFLSCGV